MSVLTFRQATAADLPAIVALLRDDMLGAGREGEAEDPAYAQAFAAMEAQGGNRVLLACDGEEVVGCLQLILIPGLSLNGMLRAQIEGVRAAAS
ncbi:MAG: GNAT family N-acetyltransferase, partial [Pseudomonadota bacterium]